MQINLSLLRLPFQLPKRRQAIVEGKLITSCKQCYHCARIVSPHDPKTYWCESLKMSEVYKVLSNPGVIPAECPFVVKPQ